MHAIRVPGHILRAAAASLADADQREMAVPSYTHWNPVIRWLFWKRLDIAVDLGHVERSEAVFEFASGTGILLPTHHAVAGRVAVTDLHAGPSIALAKMYGTSTEHVPLEALASWAEANRSAFDCVYAIDCLDHLSNEELASAIPMFADLLREGGRLVMVGPTESIFYRLGRWIAGFKNEYHHRTVFDVDLLLRHVFKRDAWIRVPPLPLPTGFMIGRYIPRRR